MFQVKVIPQTVMAVIQTVNSRWPLRMGQRCRTSEVLPEPNTIIGHAWILRAQIIMDWLHADLDSMAAGLEGDLENEDRITKINTRLQGLFGAQFEKLFGKLHGNVIYLWFSAIQSTFWMSGRIPMML
jgi:hypothetical protein